MTTIAGQTITDVVTLRDGAGALVTGASWVVLYSKTQGGASAATEITETASPGTYLIETATENAGDYHRILVANDAYPWFGTAHVVSGANPFESAGGQLYSEVVYVSDGDGAGIGGIEFTTENAFDPNGDAFALVVTPVSGVSGGYIASVAPDLVGAWAGELVTDTDPVQRYRFSVQVSAAIPVSSLTLVQGQSYLAADGEALTWQDAAWPALDDVLVTLTLSPGFGEKVYPAITLDDAVISVDLSSADTARLEAGRTYPYEVRGEFDRDRTRSLVVGVISVVAP